MHRLGSSLEIYGGVLDGRSSVIRNSFLRDRPGHSSHHRLTPLESCRIEFCFQKSTVDQGTLFHQTPGFFSVLCWLGNREIKKPFSMSKKTLKVTSSTHDTHSRLKKVDESSPLVTNTLQTRSIRNRSRKRLAWLSELVVSFHTRRKNKKRQYRSVWKQSSKQISATALILSLHQPKI